MTTVADLPSVVEGLDVPDAVKNEFHLLLDRLARAETEIERQRSVVRIRNGELEVERRRVKLLESNLQAMADQARSTISKSLSYMGQLGQQDWPRDAAIHAAWSGQG